MQFVILAGGLGTRLRPVTLTATLSVPETHTVDAWWYPTIVAPSVTSTQG